MIELSEYKLEMLRKDGEFILYRGERRRQTGVSAPSILAVTPASKEPALASLGKMEHEYSLRAGLGPEWAVRPLDLSHHDGQMTLVLENPGGEPLDRVIRGPMEITQFLRFGVGLTAALGHLHERGLIHKDVKPPNVLVNSASSRVWLMGFGIASRLPRERQSPEPPEFIAGTLPYMAPEQTGRMNRSIDARSDLYALGVTLYEMLTGSLPFTASDPLEWVHCHIARQPAPPGERVKDVPDCISAIIMKLLAKTAEERYQTATGAGSDLRRCLAEWEAQRRIPEFPLGEHDIPDQLLLPEKLYGRAHEIDALLASFNRVVATGTPELALVSGYSGIGKSSVVNELHKVLVLPRGLFASGKFDQYKRDIPYATLAQAFQGLIRPLLGKSDAELRYWRGALGEALGPNGRLIMDLVPELKHIIGEQPPVPDLPPQDAHARFQLVFRRFIGVFARPEHPLALFLHDRVQEAAYSLIPADLRAVAHLRIGRLLAAHTPPRKREEAIFEIVNQFNRGAALITLEEEREQLAELNLIAGQRAKASTAYASALTYLVAGAALLAEDSWERRRQLTFALELNRAECEFLTGALAEAERRLTALSARAATTVERASVTCLQADLYTTLDQSDRAVAVCLEYLRKMGIDWSPHPTKEEVRCEYERVWSQVGSRAIEELIELPLMSDPESLATLDVLTKVVPPALYTDANLVSLASCRAVNLSLESGNSDGSCVAYVWLGTIAGPHFDDFKAGFRFGRLGYELVEQRGLKRFQARVYMCFGSHVMPWTKHVLAGRDLVCRAFDAANEIGDLLVAAYSCDALNTILLTLGCPLPEVQREAEKGLEFARKARFGIVIDIITAQLGLIRILRGLTPKFGCFDDGQFNELRFELHLASDPVLALPEC